MAGFGVSGGLVQNETTHAQKQARRYVRKVDQHGRRWGMNIEGQDGHNCGPMEYQKPRGGFWPPILPPPAYLKHAREPDPNDPEAFIENRVVVDYAAWKADIRQAWTDFTTRVHEEYAQRNLECDWTPDNGVAMRMDVREKVGRDPDPIEPVLACEQGNRWALYGEGKMPSALAPFFRRLATVKSALGAREAVTFEDAAEEAEAVETAIEQADASVDLDEAFDPAAKAAALLRQAKPKNKGGRPRKSAA